VHAGLFSSGAAKRPGPSRKPKARDAGGAETTGKQIDTLDQVLRLLTGKKV
jgi:hypothetical protein